MATMKSYAHQTVSGKRVKKLAARYTDQEIRASLQEDENNRAYIDERNPPTVGYWNTHNGPLTIMNDDAVLAYAQVQFLRRNGYPSFKSDREILAYAEQNGWSREIGGG